jgi:hypothetical protein
MAGAGAGALNVPPLHGTHAFASLAETMKDTGKRDGENQVGHSRFLQNFA